MTPRTSNAQRLWVHMTPLSLMSLLGADLPLDALLVNFNKICPVRVVNHLGGRCVSFSLSNFISTKKRSTQTTKLYSTKTFTRLTRVFFELPRFRTDIVDINPNDPSSCELQAAGQTDPSERLAASTLPMPAQEVRRHGQDDPARGMDAQQRQ
ncbi:hypothetical protein B0H14DRAFT_1493332 [Mycena olivaceomarginata]|nr:hypothetical protein B0H14DRAFT_1493332 [Mycena olivaceomarginata]